MLAIAALERGRRPVFPSRRDFDAAAYSTPSAPRTLCAPSKPFESPSNMYSDSQASRTEYDVDEPASGGGIQTCMTMAWYLRRAPVSTESPRACLHGISASRPRRRRDPSAESPRAATVLGVVRLRREAQPAAVGAVLREVRVVAVRDVDRLSHDVEARLRRVVEDACGGASEYPRGGRGGAATGPRTLRVAATALPRSSYITDHHRACLRSVRTRSVARGSRNEQTVWFPHRKSCPRSPTRPRRSRAAGLRPARSADRGPTSAEIYLEPELPARVPEFDCRPRGPNLIAARSPDVRVHHAPHRQRVVHADDGLRQNAPGASPGYIHPRGRAPTSCRRSCRSSRRFSRRPRPRTCEGASDRNGPHGRSARAPRRRRDVSGGPTLHPRLASPLRSAYSKSDATGLSCTAFIVCLR